MHPSVFALSAAALLGLAAPCGAQDRVPIFDAHMHYNWEPKPYYEVDQVLDLFRRNGVTGVLATSRPNDGTRALVAARAQGVRIVPFIRPYRVRADIQTWFKDPSILKLVQEEFARGYYRGIGEFHLHGNDAKREIAERIVRFAVERNLYLHAHCDEAALEILFGHDRRARIIWAHTGFSTSAERVAELLEKYPALWGELSYRGGITDGSGTLTPEWRALFTKYPDRFLVGSDTWTSGRWSQYDEIIKDYRGWLSQLPPAHARLIAHENAERLFGLRRDD